MSKNVNENKLRLLKLEEVQGENSLEVIKRKGAMAVITDFALYQHAYALYCYNNRIYGAYYIDDACDDKTAIVINGSKEADKRVSVASRKDRSIRNSFSNAI